jgi:hypothetical protein
MHGPKSHHILPDLESVQTYDPPFSNTKFLPEAQISCHLFPYSAPRSDVNKDMHLLAQQWGKIRRATEKCI